MAQNHKHALFFMGLGCIRVLLFLCCNNFWALSFQPTIPELLKHREMEVKFNWKVLGKSEKLGIAPEIVHLSGIVENYVSF